MSEKRYVLLEVERTAVGSRDDGAVAYLIEGDSIESEQPIWLNPSRLKTAEEVFCDAARLLGGRLWYGKPVEGRNILVPIDSGMWKFRQASTEDCTENWLILDPEPDEWEKWVDEGARFGSKDFSDWLRRMPRGK